MTSIAGLTEDVTRIRAAVAASTGDVSEACTLPPECYTSAPFFEFEKAAVFGRSWSFACHVSEIPAAGDFVTFTIADEPIIVVRASDGAVNAMTSVCQHRGYPLVETPGSTTSFRCPYHYWTYDLEGRLVSAPSMRPDHSLNELRAAICLPRFAVEVWHGLVFVNLDAQAAPLAPTITRFGAAIAEHRIEDMVVADVRTFPDLAFNWKNMQENALEEYHTSYIHKGLHDNAPAHLVEHAPYQSGENAMFRRAGLVVPAGNPVAGQPTFPVIDGLSAHGRGHLVFGAVPPMLFVALMPHGAKLYRIAPLAVDRITLTIYLLLPSTSLTLPDVDLLLQATRERLELVDVPDIHTSERMYRGLRSQFAPRGPLSHQERTLTQFNQWLLDQYSAA
jgi:phenylpropionate dioxygenase-like ring-hydroxylating dioxygenase large terminal subunit